MQYQTKAGRNQSFIEGCILAVIIVFLFLGEWETTLISAISLPVSIITTFIAVKVMDHRSPAAHGQAVRQVLQVQVPKPRSLVP